ncbi:hypothetical protein GCM10009555_045910 [Acrocarpospora macrocephala]|uniref:Preprotein translocase SecA n=1 Tax=Acrocarpospora macrocephala TaxID=150177 RepID=A0A5M3WD41_9ACTN|nr:SEC-C metal-binding domain-containing protein [Acrocarpospora macrocephala]GES06746.1 hypothetical protein Amac_003410 [Acrocarpospora macrocephala]
MSSNDLVSLGELEYARRAISSGTSVDALVDRFLAAVADPALRTRDFDAGQAMVVVSEILEDAGRLDEALAVLRRADAEGIRGEYLDPAVWVPPMLHRLGRYEEAAAAFRELVKAGRADWTAYEVYAEQLEIGNDLAGALKILLSGQDRLLRQGHRRGAEILAVPLSRVQRAMGLPVDEPVDQDDWEEWDDEPDVREIFTGGVLHWPQADFGRLLTRWPGLAERIGADWDEHRTRTEKASAAFTARGIPAVLCHADYASFTAFAPDIVDEPPKETLDGYINQLHRQGATTRWPPERNARCWCGSGRKYKQCCRPRGFTA